MLLKEEIYIYNVWVTGIDELKKVLSFPAHLCSSSQGLKSNGKSSVLRMNITKQPQKQPELF